MLYCDMAVNVTLDLKHMDCSDLIKDMTDEELLRKLARTLVEKPEECLKFVKFVDCEDESILNFSITDENGNVVREYSND